MILDNYADSTQIAYQYVDDVNGFKRRLHVPRYQNDSGAALIRQNIACQ